MNIKGSRSAARAAAESMATGDGEDGYQIPQKGRKWPAEAAGERVIRLAGTDSAGAKALIYTSSMAARVWDLLDDRRPLAEIAGTIAGEFSLPRERALEETRGYLRLFAEGDMNTVSG